MHRKITASLVSKWQNLQFGGTPTLEQYDDLRYDFGTSLPFFINPLIYEQFPFTSLGEPAIILTNLTPATGEAWVLFCYHPIGSNENSPLRIDGFMLPFEWRANTEHSHLIPESFQKLADQILSSSFLFSSLSVNSWNQTSRWGLHPSFQRFGESIDFSDNELFGENIGSAWGALAVGLVAARNCYVPATWPFCSLQFNYAAGCPVNVDGIDRKLAVAASYGCREFVVAPNQVTEAIYALEELKKRAIPGCGTIRIVGSETQPETIINSILYSKIDWLTDTIRTEIRKEKELDRSNSNKENDNKLFKPENIASGLAGGASALGAGAIFSELMAADKNNNEDVRNPYSAHSINSVDDVHSHEPGNTVMTTGYNAPKKWGIDSTDIVSPVIQQEHPDTCAIRSQELVLRDFGINVSEDELVNKALENGWYHTGNGTPMNEVGNLLEEYNIPVNRFENANIFTLCSELAQNHKVIIGVDSGELWHKGTLEKIEDMIGIKGADHALLVSGIDTSDINNIKVILTDPGTGDVAKEYPADQFMDAWKDSGYYMVATKDPVPAWNPSSVHFDYEAGHLTSFGDWQFSELIDAVGQSNNIYSNENLYMQPEVVNQLFQHHSVSETGCNIHDFNGLNENHNDDSGYFHSIDHNLNDSFDIGIDQGFTTDCGDDYLFSDHENIN